MRNTITLNGVESSTIPGLLIQELPAISKPLMRTEVETIDGRDGDITTDLGFSAYDKQISIGLFADYDIDQIIAYFNSKGTVIFSNEPDKFYNYEIVDQIDFERLVRYRTATVTMHCQPFKYSTTEGADILSTNSNFATLNQSLNTDSGFYTYSSNVQDDITATRQSGTGGKFFAVFSVPVVQGVTYYFSGNVSKNVSMYGYTNQLRGTSAGISGKGFNGYFTYTATFTGTMVLGFYSNATAEIFIRNFKVSNQSTSTVSGEGTSITLEGTAEAPFSRFDLKGNTEQTGTPTPTNPTIVKVVTGAQTIRICGKNLFDKDAPVENRYLNDSGGWTTVANPECINQEYGLNGGATLQISFSGKVGSPYVRIGQYDANGIFIRRTLVSTSPQAINLQSDTAKVIFSTTAISASHFENLQIEKNSTVTNYEVFNGESYEVNLGKNLFNKDSVTTNAWLLPDGTTQSSSGWAVSDFIPVDSGEKYYLPKTGTRRLKYYNGGKTALTNDWDIAGGGNNQVITIPVDACYVRFTIQTSSISLDDFQFEKGDIATSYAPYFEPIELAKIGGYQDKFVNINGSWYVRRAVGKHIFDDSEASWVQHSTIEGGYVLGYNGNSPLYGLLAAGTPSYQSFCSHFAFQRDNTTWVGENKCGFNTSGAFWCINPAQTTKNDFLAWLKNASVTIYYPLANTVDEAITNEALIEQLNNITNNAHGHRTRTHINSTYPDGYVPHIIAAELTTDPSGTITNSGNIYSKPKLTIFGSGSVGVYLNGVQMFQIALGTNDYITIDTAIMEAYQDNLQTLKNRSVTGDYNNFKLPVGESEISFSGSVTMCVVENYSRWL